MANLKKPVLRVEGGDEILAALKKIEPSLAKKATRKAIRAGLKPMLAAAKANAPVKTGRVKKAIRIAAAKRSRNRIGVRITIGEKNFVGKSFYGAFQEFGWKTGRRDSEPDKRTQIPGKHFLENAFDTKGREAVAITRAELQKSLDESVKEAAGVIKAPKS